MSHSGGQNGGDPTGPVGPVQGGRISTSPEISDASFATATEGAQAAGPVDAAEGEAASRIGGVGEAGATQGTAAVAESLQAGRVDAAQAQALLIEQAIAAHIPPDADPALIESLRSELTLALADDPTLSALLG